jgi:hypothetical protein
MPEQNDPAKETSEPWEGWRNDPISEPAPGWSVEVHQGPSFIGRGTTPETKARQISAFFSSRRASRVRGKGGLWKRGPRDAWR